MPEGLSAKLLRKLRGLIPRHPALLSHMPSRQAKVKVKIKVKIKVKVKA
jgi:hypothetical protein